MNLLIVESPTKAKTLKNFLGKNYEIKASMGHVRDLPKGDLGVNVEKNFKPKYVIPTKSRKTLSALKKEITKADDVILATDEDREGESIAWHLSEALNLRNPRRIVFHEITKTAIEEALKSPRKIDMNLVDAQQARRILDRLVGYKLSPFLWKKVAKGLSAGRVQSVAVRLVVEREREIENFVAQEYWTIVATLLKIKNQKSKIKNNEFEALLVKKDDKPIQKLDIKSKEEADKILKDLKGVEYQVEKIARKEVKKNPLPPFTTSTLQQEAWQRFKFPAKLTMQLAQQLYEKGYISYHRTDSLNLSDLSLFSAKKFIIEDFGEKYWAGFLRRYKAKGKVQEAHEAIRPTYSGNTPEKLKIKAKLEERQFRLYDLIWRRFIACQMKEAFFDATIVDIKTKGYGFRANGQILKFDGFLKVYPMKFEETELPELEEKEILELIKLSSSQHFTQPPSRYTEATLIKTLEKFGIGRPSTYAPTLATIQTRNYVKKNEQKKFIPTEIGAIVNDILVQNFPKVVDIDFTAKMEKELDEVSEGKNTWQKTCQNFWIPFSKDLEKRYKEVKKSDLVKETDEICPKCGAPMVERFGKFGKFYACSKFPECKYTKSLENKNNNLGIKCPKCLASRDLAQRDNPGEIVSRKTKKGKIFYGCSRFPKCDFALWDKPFVSAQGKPEFCPECDSILVEKRKKIICSNKECRYEK